MLLIFLFFLATFRRLLAIIWLVSRCRATAASIWKLLTIILVDDIILNRCYLDLTLLTKDVADAGPDRLRKLREGGALPLFLLVLAHVYRRIYRPRIGRLIMLVITQLLNAQFAKVHNFVIILARLRYLLLISMVNIMDLRDVHLPLYIVPPLLLLLCVARPIHLLCQFHVVVARTRLGALLHDSNGGI